MSTGVGVSMKKVSLAGNLGAELEAQVEEPVAQSEHAVSVEAYDPSVTLPEHIALNVTKFEAWFPDFNVDGLAQMLRRHGGPKRFLFSSAVDRYDFLHPALYRLNCAIKDIKFDDLV